MTLFSTDPIINAINNGIRHSINTVLDNKCYGAAVILLFAGMDAMANLNRPAGTNENTSNDFKDWVAKYFYVHGQTKITPDEWWAARNAIIHTYGAIARQHRQDPNVRLLGWMVGSTPHIRFDGTKAPNVAFVDILAMRDAFFSGMDRFLIEGFADQDRKQLLEQRISDLVMEFPG